jgi:hypothetical protein
MCTQAAKTTDGFKFSAGHAGGEIARFYLVYASCFSVFSRLRAAVPHSFKSRAYKVTGDFVDRGWQLFSLLFACVRKRVFLT